MRPSEIEGEQALDVLCEMMEPAATIMADPEIRDMYKAKVPRIKIIIKAIQNHKKEVIQIMAASEMTPVEEYHFNLVTLPRKLLELVNDPSVRDLFTSQGQTGDAKSSGSVSANTEEK